jgi:hypothetical protein
MSKSSSRYERYNFVQDSFGSGRLFPFENGEWIRYREVKHLIEKETKDGDETMEQTV